MMGSVCLKILVENDYFGMKLCFNLIDVLIIVDNLISNVRKVKVFYIKFVLI